MSSFPMFVMRNCTVFLIPLVCMLRSTQCVMCPAWLGILSMFHIFHGLCRSFFPSFILLMKASPMKQLVAPESTSALMSAIALLVLIEMGICMDRNRIVTITELNLWTALTQADGFRRSENPLSRRGLSLPVLPCLLLLWLLLGAMNRLSVGEFVYLIVRLLVVLCCIRFDRQLSLLTLN